MLIQRKTAASFISMALVVLSTAAHGLPSDPSEPTTVSSLLQLEVPEPSAGSSVGGDSEESDNDIDEWNSDGISSPIVSRFLWISAWLKRLLFEWR